MWKRITAVASLFFSFGTLFCCALPALLVSLGMGAAMAGLVSNVPQLVVLSEHKDILFVTAGMMLIASTIVHSRTAAASCPVDDVDVAEACSSIRGWSVYVLWFSIAIYGVGGFFAYIAPTLVN